MSDERVEVTRQAGALRRARLIVGALLVGGLGSGLWAWALRPGLIVFRDALLSFATLGLGMELTRVGGHLTSLDYGSRQEVDDGTEATGI
ncbi:MAG: hypothetical protein Q8K82_24810 [Gemmatimonadaceae bacterium]|nr:hypothetical protein [Gemmatimonadaceae bacterium]